jgi:serine/threonine-protein kinase
VGDLCGADQQDLLPALRYLVVCPPFLRALRASPPLADPRLAAQLRTELRQVFAPALCARMEPVIDQLLDQPPAPGRREVALPAAVPTPPPAPAAPVPAAPARAAAPEPAPSPPQSAEAQGRGGSPAGLVALLAFLSGGLAVALAAVLTGVGLPRRSPPSPPIAAPSRLGQPESTRPNPAERQPQGSPQTPTTPAPPELPAPPQDNAALPSTPEPPAAGDAGASHAGGDTAVTSSVAAAVAGVEALYTALSAGDPAGALQRMDGSAADQFDPAFFRQFREVGVTELRPTATEGSIVTLDGVVTFVYPDGSRQRESRTFTVNTARTPPRITASAFGRVLSPRR